MKLEELVPPLELCRKIPAGNFVDSALCWIVRPALYNETNKAKMWGYYVGFEFQIDKELKEKRHAPAPTLQEIMAALPACTCYRLGDEWTIGFVNDDIGNCVKSANPANAALKLWLKLKGIEEMSKRIIRCPKCGEKENLLSYSNNPNIRQCGACKFQGNYGAFEAFIPTVFQEITASEGVLAKELIYYHYGKYHSTIVPGVKGTYKKVYDATVEKLNEVGDDR